MVLKWLGSSCHRHQSGSGFGDPLLPLSLPSVPRASPSHGKPVYFVVGGGGAVFLLLSFVSSLQMQQKVKVTMCSDRHFPLPLWPRCLPTLLLLLLLTALHPMPSPGTLQL